MTLSNKALTELKEILRKERGEAFVRALTDEEINHLGQLFLEIMAEGLKLRVRKNF